MARACRLLILIAAAAASVCAQATSANPETTPVPPKTVGRGVKRSPEFEDVRKAIEALTPEQRKRFQENFWRWSNLSPEEKKALRDRDEMRRKRMAEEIEAAVRETGLDLDKDRHELFAKRYGEERRKIEEQLRREMEEKRGPLVKELIGRLKTEFGAPTANP
jgi:hypothetical protein